MEDASDPVGKVVAGAVVAEHAPVAAGKFCFQLAQVGSDRTGRAVGFGPEVEPLARLDPGAVVLMLVAEVRGGPRPEGERDRLAGVRSPGQHCSAGRPLDEPGDLRTGQSGYGGCGIHQLVRGVRRAQGDHDVEAG